MEKSDERKMNAIMDTAPTYISATQVNHILTWVLVVEAVQEAMIAIVNKERSESALPYASQPLRSVTKCGDDSKLLFSMPSFVGDYNLTVPGNGTTGKRMHSTLASKLVTSFRGNDKLEKPLPNIMANILLFSVETGQLQCIMDGTQITAWRTAGASIVATKYLYFARFPEQATQRAIKVAIIGCGVQGQSHALGMCATFNVTDIYLWNRTQRKAEQLRETLIAKYPNINVVVAATAADAVEHADVINVATYSPVSLINFSMIKKQRIHINTVGAGEVHFGEVDQSIYDNAVVYVDSSESAKVELSELKATIIGEVGQVIISKKYPQINGITIFQSMGMAVEDATVAQAVFDAYENKL